MSNHWRVKAGNSTLPDDRQFDLIVITNFNRHHKKFSLAFFQKLCFDSSKLNVQRYFIGELWNE